jgi:hypothetical protein
MTAYAFLTVAKIVPSVLISTCVSSTPAAAIIWLPRCGWDKTIAFESLYEVLDVDEDDD